MKRDFKPSNPPLTTMRAATVEVVQQGDTALLTIVGLIDERFAGFGQLNHVKSLVLDVANMTRMTSFGVRQWLNGMEELKSVADLYLLNCPTFFVDQLNMVLNFGGSAKVLTAVAPYVCPACGVESGELVDVMARRGSLTREPPEKTCSRCGAKLEFDESPDSYFGFAAKYAASSIQPAVAQLLTQRGLYMSGDAPDKPPRIIKLIHGSVTYFRIIGTIGSMFRARPFLVGAEGEVVLDLADVDRFDPSGQREWRRLIKSLATQVTTITLVDLPPTFLALAGQTLTSARNISVSSLTVPFRCQSCERTTNVSESLTSASWPQLPDRVCPTCGGTAINQLSAEALEPLLKASTLVLPASAKVVEQRDELMSRAMTDASVAQSGGGGSAVSTDDMILGKYKIVRRLSGGGMAEVYLAKQVGLGGFEKAVALKLIHQQQLESRRQAIELFLNEAKIAGRLTHPNIVQVLDVGETGGNLYLAMEYVNGKDVRDVLKVLKKTEGVMPLAEACYIMRETAAALDYAYWSSDMTGKRLSVVHRDVSPHNVILGFDGSVKLLDFGVAMSSITEHEQALLVGKWTYMSPETTMNGKADHRSDLFSLGVVFYLLCAGVMPFFGAEPKEIVRKIRAGDYPHLEEIAPQIPPRLANLIAKLLAPNPDQRPQRGRHVVEELDTIAREFGLESSGLRISEFLSTLFATPIRTTAEFVRVYPDDSHNSLQTRIDPSPFSITPSARTSKQTLGSQSFQRVPRPSGSISVTVPPSRVLSAKQELVQRAAWRSSVVNAMITVAILIIAVIGAYFIVSSL
jgi:eukaryotic-like serine/threonine-protein kinase